MSIRVVFSKTLPVRVMAYGLLFGTVACINEKKLIRKEDGKRVVYHLGYFSGIDYITIEYHTGKVKSKIEIQGSIGYYDKVPKLGFFRTIQIKDSAKASRSVLVRDSTERGVRIATGYYSANSDGIEAISNEEITLIKNSFAYFPNFNERFGHFKTDSLAVFLGWLVQTK